MRSRMPKVLQPLAGRPLLAHVIDVAAALAPSAIQVVYGHGGEQVRDAFGSQAPRSPAASADVPLQWVRQAEQLGTGNALAQALPGIAEGQQVMVLYGDVPLLQPATLLALRERAGRDGLALLTAELQNPSGYGRIVRDRRGAISRIVEHGDARERERRIREINTGVLVGPAARLRRWVERLTARNAQRELYLTDAVAMAVRERWRVQSLVASDPEEILGVNDKQQLAQAEAVYRRRRAQELMSRGVTIVDPSRIDLRGPIEVGADVLLDVNVVLEGPVQLGDGVAVGPNCVVSRASIGSGTQVYANSVIQDAQVEADCRIGPYARLRPGARLGRGAHIGNFVEIKNSAIGAGSKANHLSYVGDATVGAGVNIGAGTITCNYDGVDKYPTRIGDGAFIGSGSMLVAPVTIGEQATIGAGSTITADAPAGKLTLARSRQLTIQEWQRRRKGSGSGS